MPPTATDRARLASLGARRRELRKELAKVRKQMREAIPIALEHGMSVVEISKLVGMTRRGVYQALEAVKGDR